MEQMLVMPLSQESSSQFALKPILIKDVLLLTSGRWNDTDYTDHEISKAFNNTNWHDRKFRSLYLDHQDTKERGVANWAGYVLNPRMKGTELRGDLELWNPMVAAFLTQAKAKFGISATLAGRENKQLGRMEDFHFESFSIVTDPACKVALINLSSNKNLVSESVQTVTMENQVTPEGLVELDNSKEDFCSKLDEMLADEKKAPSDYEKLKSLTENEDFKRKIDEIISDEKKHHEILTNIKSTKELADFTSGSPSTIHALEPVKIDNPKKSKDEEELGAKFERQVQHIKDSLKKAHPDWSEEKITSTAYATANSMKENTAELSYEKGRKIVEKMAKDDISGMDRSIFERKVQEIADQLKHDHSDWEENKIEEEAYKIAKSTIENSMRDHHVEDKSQLGNNLHSEKTLLDLSKKQDSDYDAMKGGLNTKMPEKEEGKEDIESKEKKEDKETKVDPKAESKEEAKKEMADVESPKEDKKESPEAEKAEEKKSEKKEEEENLSADQILNQVKGMSVEELSNYTAFAKSYLSSNASASAKEVTLAYMKSQKEKAAPKELSATELLAAIDARISSIKELDSSKKLQEMEKKVQELSAKVKTPDRKTLSVAYEGSSPQQDSNVGFLNYLKNRL